jgi:hypothetical protein
MQCHKYVLGSRVNSAGALLVREVLLVLHSAVHIMYSRVNDFGPSTIMGHLLLVLLLPGAEARQWH